MTSLGRGRRACTVAATWEIVDAIIYLHAFTEFSRLLRLLHLSPPDPGALIRLGPLIARKGALDMRRVGVDHAKALLYVPR